jgi:hypothetical protein
MGRGEAKGGASERWWAARRSLACGDAGWLGAARPLPASGGRGAWRGDRRAPVTARRQEMWHARTHAKWWDGDPQHHATLLQVEAHRYIMHACMYACMHACGMLRLQPSMNR